MQGGQELRKSAQSLLERPFHPGTLLLKTQRRGASAFALALRFSLLTEFPLSDTIGIEQMFYTQREEANVKTN